MIFASNTMIPSVALINTEVSANMFWCLFAAPFHVPSLSLLKCHSSLSSFAQFTLLLFSVTAHACPFSLSLTCFSLGLTLTLCYFSKQFQLYHYLKCLGPYKKMKSSIPAMFHLIEIYPNIFFGGRGD